MGSGVAQTISSKDPKAAAAAASDMRNVVRRKLTGYVGFANLPNQWHRKSVRKGFSFNVMVVGRLCHTVPGNHNTKVTQASQDWENPPSSILSSTPLSTHLENAKVQVWTSFQKLSRSSLLAQILKRMVCVFD